MKKLLTVILIITLILSAAASVAFAEQSSSEQTPQAQEQAPSEQTQERQQIINELRIDVEQYTNAFCDEFPDRTSFTEANKIAAEGLKAHYDGSAKFRADLQEYSLDVSVSNGLFGYEQKTIYSYNVVVTQKERDVNKKTILFTAPFANHYSANEAGEGVGAEGALYNAASVSLVLALGDRLDKQTDSKYNYMFAFFSGTDEGNFGSEHFVDEYLDQNIILVVNFDRLGSGESYFYTDEAETEHGNFIKKIGADYSLKEFPVAGRVILDMETVDGLSYSNYAMRGDIAPFLSRGKSCLELIGGDFSGLTDGETFLTNTKLDTVEQLNKLYPDYAEKLANVGAFVLDLVSRTQLEEVCVGAASSYKVFTKSWIAYVICLGIIVVLILIMLLVMRSFEKKYPLPKAPNVKIAVFGKEFEDINDNDIIVDIKHDDDDKGDDSPFDI